MADSLALTLGVPAALGWDGSVRDDEAIGFTREVYEAMSRRRHWNWGWRQRGGRC